MTMISERCLVWRWLAEMPRSEYCTGSRYLGIVFNFASRSWLITDQIFADWHEHWEDSHPAKSTILPPWATWKSWRGVWRELLRRELVHWAWASGRWSSWALSLMWNRMVVVATASHDCNALQIGDTAAIKAQHSFEVVMICLQRLISHNLSWLKLNNFILVKTLWIWETKKVFERHFTSAERRRVALSPSISSPPLLISLDIA